MIFEYKIHFLIEDDEFDLYPSADEFGVVLDHGIVGAKSYSDAVAKIEKNYSRSPEDSHIIDIEVSACDDLILVGDLRDMLEEE